jgi:hypothetical protein
MIFPFIFSIGAFLLYIQFSPKMGNIWYRNGYFTPKGALSLIVYPLQEIKMWNPNLWDINYFIWIIFTYLIIIIYNYLKLCYLIKYND